LATVTRDAWSLSAGLAALLFATVAAAQSDGKAAFESRCARCHAPQEIHEWATKEPDAVARQSWLEGFLQRHHAREEEERRAIIEHIEQVIATEAAAGEVQ
jgi:mono/diheme cytochrome c family protein